MTEDECAAWDRELLVDFGLLPDPVPTFEDESEPVPKRSRYDRGPKDMDDGEYLG